MDVIEILMIAQEIATKNTSDRDSQEFLSLMNKEWDTLTDENLDRIRFLANKIIKKNV